MMMLGLELPPLRNAAPPSASADPNYPQVGTCLLFAFMSRCLALCLVNALVENEHIQVWV